MAVMAVNQGLYYHLYHLQYLSDNQEVLAVGRWLLHEEGAQPWRCMFEHHQHKDKMSTAFQIYRGAQCLITRVEIIDLTFGEKKNPNEFQIQAQDKIISKWIRNF